jgi:hypothetical protein
MTPGTELERRFRPGISGVKSDSRNWETVRTKQNLIALGGMPS